MDRMMEEVQERGSDLAVSLKLAHHLDRMGMQGTVLKDYGTGLHGEDAVVCIRKVFLPLAKAYLQRAVAPEQLADSLEAGMEEAAQPHLWLDYRRAVVLARKPF
jgi:hypothetical protein